MTDDNGENKPLSAREKLVAQVAAQQQQQAERSIEILGETIQKKVIFEALHQLLKVDNITASEAIEHIALDTPLKTQEARLLLRDLGYEKGSAYAGELKKIAEVSFVGDKVFRFDPSDILKKLTPMEREMIPYGKTNVAEFAQRRQESAVAQHQMQRRIRENLERFDAPKPQPKPVDRSIGKTISPELARAAEEGGFKPGGMQRRVDDAWAGKPEKPAFYDKLQPPANPDVKKNSKPENGEGGPK